MQVIWLAFFPRNGRLKEQSHELGLPVRARLGQDMFEMRARGHLRDLEFLRNAAWRPIIADQGGKNAALGWRQVK